MDAFKNLMYLIIAVTVLWAIWGGDVRQIASRAGPVIDTDPAALMTAYRENEIAADQQFKGKRVRLAGKVETISRDLLGNAYLIIEAPGLFGIQCFVADSTAAKLSKGQTVRFEGMVDGKFGNVVVKDCLTL